MCAIKNTCVCTVCVCIYNIIYIFACVSKYANNRHCVYVSDTQKAAFDNRSGAEYNGSVREVYNECGQ